MTVFSKANQFDLSDENAFASYVNSQTTSNTGPLRTTASINRDPQYAATSYNISDILQGALAVQDPSDPLLIANQFLTKRLDDIYEANPDKQFALLSGSFESTRPDANTDTVYGESGFNDDNSINSQWVSQLPLVASHSNSLSGPTTSGPESSNPNAKNIMLWSKTGLASEAMHLPVAQSIEDDIRKHIQSPTLRQTRKHPYFMDRDAQDETSTSAPFAGADGYAYNWDYGEQMVPGPDEKTFGNEDPNRPGKKGAFGILDPKSEQWYVSMPWPSQINAGQWTDIGLATIDDFIKKENLILSNYAGCKILVYHPKSKKAVVATPGDIGPRPSELKYSPVLPNESHLIGLSPDICEYFGLISMKDVVTVGFVDDTWELGPYQRKVLNPIDLDPGYTPNTPGNTPSDPIAVVSPTDWSVGVGSKVLVDSLEELEYAARLIRDHPNFWASKQEVNGTRHGYGPHRTKYCHKSFTYGFDSTSPDTAIRINRYKAWIFPSLMNFLWIALESGWIFDGFAGGAGSKTDPNDDIIAVHESGSAVDFAFLGHVDHGGGYQWKLHWATFPTRGRNGGPSDYDPKRFGKPPTNNPKHMHWYTKYSELVNLFAQFISSLPKDKRPSGVGAPFAVANSVIHQDWKPNHMHIDFYSYSKNRDGVSVTGRIGKLIPQLKR